MNTPNPLMPQSSLLQSQSQGKSTVRVAVFAIAALHAVFITGILLQGCNREKPATAGLGATNNVANELPPIEKTASDYLTSSEEIPAAAPAPTQASNLTGGIAQAPPAQTAPDIREQPAGEMKEYTVVRGDNLSKIARAHGVKLSALTQANANLDTTMLKPGQKLQIPPPTVTSPGAAPVSGIGFAEPGRSELDSGGSVHVVKPNENLTRIARQHGTTIKALRTANNLRTDRLSVGQKLKIPAAAPAPSPLSATNPAHIAPLSSGTGTAQR